MKVIASAAVILARKWLPGDDVVRRSSSLFSVNLYTTLFRVGPFAEELLKKAYTQGSTSGHLDGLSSPYI